MHQRLCGALIGFAGTGAGFAALAWSGDSVLEQSLAAEPHRRTKKKNQKANRSSWTKTWELTVDLEPAMNPLAGTLSLPARNRYALRLFDPNGREVFAQDGSSNGPRNSIGNRESTSCYFMYPIEVTTAGPHRIECDVPHYVDTSLSLRRNAILPTTTWFFSMVGLAIASGAAVIFSVMIANLGRSKGQPTQDNLSA